MQVSSVFCCFICCIQELSGKYKILKTDLGCAYRNFTEFDNCMTQYMDHCHLVHHLRHHWSPVIQHFRCLCNSASGKFCGHNELHYSVHFVALFYVHSHYNGILYCSIFQLFDSVSYAHVLIDNYSRDCCFNLDK